MFYRRVESVFSDDISYERVTIDRTNGGSITSELLKPRGDSERVFERGTINAEGEGASVHNHLVFDHQGIKTWKVEVFKKGVESILKSIKFAKFEAQA